MNLCRAAALAAATILALCVVACGGGDSGETAAQTESAPAATGISAHVVAQAEGNCRWMLRGVRQIGREASQKVYKSGFELTTEGIAKPGLALIKRLTQRQRDLRNAADDPSFDAYLSFFDPIIVLGEERLEAGEAGDQGRSKRLQGLLTELGAEQREAAGRAGLRDCEIDLLGVVVREAFG
ncbi:MAG TPA: hypothetical protein VF245_00155 [Solirubrobacterales bacterium]